MDNQDRYAMKLDFGDLAQVTGGVTLGTTGVKKQAYCKKCGGKLLIVEEHYRTADGGNTSLFKCNDSRCRYFNAIKDNTEVNWL